MSTDAAALAALTPVNPFYALRYHFGMLLGVDDFETEQAYHRGKSRLHNAWLHGAGVVFGFGVTAAEGEIRVAPGLALDAAGHELYQDALACLNLAAWYEKNRQLPDLPQDPDEDGRIRFTAHVVARFRPCLTREVPALAESCVGERTDTAFSRVAEKVELILVPGPAPEAPPLAWPRVRQLFGLAPANDADVQATLASIAALAPAERPAARLDALRRFAALDGVAHGPPVEEDGQRLFPAAGCPPVVLAEVTGIVFRRDPPASPANGPVHVLENVGTADVTVRATLLPTAEVQALLCHGESGGGAAVLGPRGVSAEVVDGHTVRVRFDAPLLAATVEPVAFQISVLPVGGSPGGWHPRGVASVALPDAQTTQLTLAAELDDGFAAHEATLVRIIARGDGSAPLLGQDHRPVAGGLLDSAAGDRGQNFVVQLGWTRS